MAAIPPTSVKWFWGRISRDEAELRLKEKGLQNGLFLLRESTSVQGNYAVSLSLDNVIHHYNIERQRDGSVMIQDGKKFPGPVELVIHHQKHLDGFLTHPEKPCNRGDQPCLAFKGVTMLELDNILFEKIQKMQLSGGKLEKALGPQRQKLVRDIVKTLHTEQPWFHGCISRDEADVKLRNFGHCDGTFLIREREDKLTFALSISHQSRTKHYKIDYEPRPTEKVYAIEEGPQFESIMQLVDHYYGKTDGLLCRLRQPCVAPGYQKKDRKVTKTMFESENSAYGVRPESTSSYHEEPVEGVYAEATEPSPTLSLMRNPKNPLPAPPVSSPVNGTARTPSDIRMSQSPIDSRPPYPIPGPGGDGMSPDTEGVYGSVNVQNQTWDEPPDLIPEEPAPMPIPDSDQDLQKIYDSVPRNDNTFNLLSSQIQTLAELGSGCFGSVMEGICQQGNQEIPVAIKTLKATEVDADDSEIMKEAKLMAGLNHKHIVRMIGVCQGPPIMLVLELASLGPLNKALKKRNHLNQTNIYRIMLQVAEGMAYLESIKFVHRDLAARNVLLVNKNFAKISDFGMSKALGIGNNYYMAKEAGKWPLKWYAPESIYYWKFDSKSDVWSFGVTLWEAMSYGAKPYKGLKGQEILNLLENHKRLDKPPNCPGQVYSIMMKCWEYKKKKRPNFTELVSLMERVVSAHRPVY